MINSAFNPFMDRLSRDVRNDLSESLSACLEAGHVGPARAVAAGYLASAPASFYVEYINDRLRRYARAVDRIVREGGDVVRRGLVLWDEGLFFEVHEILEHAWMHADGEERRFLQAMIRAAGVYIKLAHGFDEAAAKIAAKALPVLEQDRARLALHTNPDRLINALRSLDSPPPVLLEQSAETDGGSVPAK